MTLSTDEIEGRGIVPRPGIDDLDDTLEVCVRQDWLSNLYVFCHHRGLDNRANHSMLMLSIAYLEISVSALCYR